MAKITSQIVSKELTKFPNTPKLTLAKKIYKDYPEQFTSVDHVRSIIKFQTGSNGKESRRTIKDKTHVKPLTHSTNPWAFIPSENNFYPEVWKLPKQYKRVLLISDIHLPYHDTKSIKACFEYAKKQGIDCVFINGDLLDFFALSFHEKDTKKRARTFEELEMGRTFLKGLKDYFNVPVYYKPANHEYRLERYLVVKAPELLDCEEFRLDVLLRLGELGINYLDRRSKTYFGSLLVEHGDRIKGTGGVNPARTLYMKYKRHTICGHFHKRSENSSKVYDGKCILTFSVGSLCNLEPEYFEVNEHTNGFAIIEVDGDEFIVNNKTIEKGKVY